LGGSEREEAKDGAEALRLGFAEAVGPGGIKNHQSHRGRDVRLSLIADPVFQQRGHFGGVGGKQGGKEQ
jgi:hypothetical protein